MNTPATNETETRGGSCAPVSLLDARVKAIEKVVKECGGEENKDGTTDPTRGVLVMLAREAAGQGFDEGVRFMASNDKLRDAGESGVEQH